MRDFSGFSATEGVCRLLYGLCEFKTLNYHTVTSSV